MEIYIIVFVLEMFLGVVFLGTTPRKAGKTRKVLYLIITTLILGTLGGLRSSLVGYDTESYYIAFTKTSDTLGGILDNDQHIETGFAALCTLVKVLGGNFTHLLLLCSFFIVGSFCVFIYRHSSNVLLSIFILLCFPYYYSSFDIIRHFVATSFLLLGFQYILKGNFRKYLLFVLMGAVFHNSALIYLILYPLLRAKWSKTLGFLLLGAAIILMLYSKLFANFVVEETGRFGTIAEEWVGGYSGGILTCVMYFAVFVIVLLAKNNKIPFSKNDNVWVICAFLLFICSIIFIEARIAIRYIMVFSGLLAVAVPNMLEVTTVRKRSFNTLLLTSFIIVGLAYHAFMLLTSWQNVVPYIPVMLNPYL